jgi:hypothetical protein
MLCRMRRMTSIAAIGLSSLIHAKMPSMYSPRSPAQGRPFRAAGFDRAPVTSRARGIIVYLISAAIYRG